MKNIFYDCSTKKQIDREEFVSMYNESYFIEGNRIISGVRQNSKIAEKEIERILNEGIKCQNDVIYILAWKIGKIRHYESDKINKTVFSKDWKKAYDGKIWRYGEQWDGIFDFIHYIVDNIDELNELSKTNPQAVLDKLRENSPKGIGTVYFITLLYFISKGKYPIYDRFAALALEGIYCGKNPLKDKIEKSVLPDKNSKDFSNVYGYIEKYSNRLSEIFSADYNKNIETYRNIDRALWVYGHAFKCN